MSYSEVEYARKKKQTRPSAEWAGAHAAYVFRAAVVRTG